MFDVLQFLFWSITYVLIIIASFSSRQLKMVSIPRLAALQNFSWEFCALLSSGGLLGHILWFSLDLIIIIFCFLYTPTRKGRYIYATALVAGFILFRIIFSIPNGMLYSSFVIDFLMAIYFLFSQKQLSPSLKLPIGITKFIGDLFAGLYYAPQSPFICMLAICVFISNLIYIYLCIMEQRMEQRKPI